MSFPTQEITSTATITSPHIIVVDLPSGAAAHVVYSVTLGEVFVTGALLALLFVALFWLVRSYADRVAFS